MNTIQIFSHKNKLNKNKERDIYALIHLFFKFYNMVPIINNLTCEGKGKV